MTPPRSPGYATDLALLLREGGQVEDHRDHLVVRTPDNPTYHWGNCLLLRSAPASGSLAGWVDTFRAAHPGADHVAIGIDDPAADPAPEEAAALGLGIERDLVLTADRLEPGGAPPGERLHQVDPDDDATWQRLVELEMTQAGSASPEEHRTFLTRRLAGHRGAIRAGHGSWCVAVLPDGSPVASLGIFEAGGGRARYQSVLTHPGHRRRGLAGALVRFAGHVALDDLGARELVIVADPEGPAIDLYRRAGFVDSTPQVALYHAPS